MSDQEKWNRIYQSADVTEAVSIALLADFAYLLPLQGKALDLACGLGANAIFLARQGLQTEAWDISDVAVANINQYAQQNDLTLVASARDLAGVDIEPDCYDVIVVSHYLDRNLFAGLSNALRSGGLIVYQTFIKDVTDDYTGPGNPDFKLDANELLKAFSDLQLLYYREEGRVGDMSHGQRNVAQLIAQKR